MTHSAEIKGDSKALVRFGVLLDPGYKSQDGAGLHGMFLCGMNHKQHHKDNFFF